MRVLAWLAVAAVMTATGAAAQTSVGNPPGNTLAPATGTVETSVPTPSTGGAVAGKTPLQLAADNRANEVICRTSIETGSLIARHKRCLTRKQWQYVNDQNEHFAREMVEENAGKVSGN